MCKVNQDNVSMCWRVPRLPTAELMGFLKAGAIFGAANKDATVARLRRDHLERPAIFIGTGTCGLGAGAARTLEAVHTYAQSQAVDIEVVQVGCVGLCSQEPILEVQLPNRTRVVYGRVTADQVPSLLKKALKGEIDEELLVGQHRAAAQQKPYEKVAYLDEYPFFKPQYRIVLANSGLIDPNDIDEYIARGGYSALFSTLRTMTSDDVCDVVLKSGLRGRGGGGFTTGQKWKLARQQSSDQKYLICNADEGDPGAFMDRAVGESDPHRLLEGMILAAYGIGATKAYIYIRAEYPLAIENLRKAIAKAEEYGFLGDNILGTGFDLHITIKMGAGAFVCGEETALMHSIEGRRGMPRPRPPYPSIQGLFDKPTVINNVETLANLPWIFEQGHESFAAIGTSGSKGTKVFALSGQVARTGLVEIPMGTTIRDVVFTVGGGTPGGKRCKAVQIGGPSGGCIPEAHMDLATDYETLKQFGAIMGSGGLVVMDETTCMVDLAKYFMEFIQSESCGKCIPCREGTRNMLEILQAITRSRHNESEIDALLRFQGVMHLERLGEVIRSTSLCGLGQTAPNPVLSTLRWFRDEYEAHIYERRCPAGSCKELVGAPCQTGCPVGTEVWRYVAHIGRGEYESAYRVIREANPFPSTCARVCHHPCETLCRAGTTGGDPIAVRSLKRFVVDHVDPSTYKPDVKEAGPHAPRVAVIGSGPAGLTAAHQLSLKGYRVTVFEKENKPGGMLVCAIPEYRLPRAQLMKEIDALLNENIELKTEVALGRDYTIDGLFEEGFKAVYLAMGAHQSKLLDIPNEEVEGVIPSIAFLKAFNLHGAELAEGHVGIIGGGNSAIDAARVARRQKKVKAVTIFYRRTQDEMPAYAEEIAAALEEGIDIRTLEAPVSVQATDGKLTGVVFQRNELGDRDASGRRRPVRVPDSEHVIEMDTLIAAISEQPEISGLDGLTITKWRTLEVNPESFTSGRPGVFGGGDLVRGPNTLIEAVADGKRVAVMIDRFIRGQQLRIIPKVKIPTIYIAPVELDESEESKPRIKSPHLPIADRQGNSNEVELCITQSQATCEACRCLRCDLEFTEPV